MNPEVLRLFAEYEDLTGDRQQAAILTLADALLTSRTQVNAPVEHVFVEPDGCHSYNVRETALRLSVKSRDVYHMILAGVLQCFRSGATVRIPLSEIERYEADVQPSTALVPRNAS